MGSIFRKEPDAQPTLPAYSIDRIAPEIAHLRNPQSVRHAHRQKVTAARIITLLAICALIGLFFMDPFVYSYQKGAAIRAYLYMHNYGSEKTTQALLDTLILSDREIATLNSRTGSFLDYYSSPTKAEETSQSVIRYMNGLRNLHSGHYDQLDPLNKARYLLFFHFGLQTPLHWGAIDPSVEP